MLTFKEFLLEDKQGKNLHLEHLEDEILNFGVVGVEVRLISYNHLEICYLGHLKVQLI